MTCGNLYQCAVLDIDMFKNQILKRYETTPEGSYLVNISVDTINHLFESFDATTDFSIRDLNASFAQYLFECVHEVRKHDFLVQLRVTKGKKDEEREASVRKALKNYFTYRMNKATIAMREIATKALFHFLLSLILLIGVLVLHTRIEGETLPYLMFVEGLTIAVWVFMWPIFSEFLYDFLRNRQNHRVYRRIRDCDVVFKYSKR